MLLTHRVDDAYHKHMAKMTLDKLGRMVKRGFDATAGRRDLETFRTEVNRRFSNIDERLLTLENRLDGLDGKLHRIETRILDDHLRRIERLEEKVGVA